MYRRKDACETALLFPLLSQFGKGEIAVMDRYDCSFMMIAASRPTERMEVASSLPHNQGRFDRIRASDCAAL